MSKMPKTFSPTRMAQFKTCPAFWNYSQRETPRVVVDDSGKLYGGSIHQLIVIYFKNIPDKPDPSDIKKEIKDLFENHRTPIMSRFTARNKKIEKNFLDFELKRLDTYLQFKPTLIENKIEYKLFDDLPPFRCIVDAYWEKDKVVVDWKTGKNEMGADFMIQGKVIELLLKRNNYPIKEVQFVGLRTGSIQLLPNISETFIYGIGKEMYDMILEERFTKHKSSLCKLCEYHLHCHYEGIEHLWS